ncbi:HlyD family secretion protein [Candidatus Protochlamydia phocaeensis]|uniref:HlyD family secretion protein n=1 Tax=Candidatus Protochlamydia phocaeensis TaxID=1414722 RepID=UPI000838DBBB|nr:HlyD family efflux transporter periplasmic adaptor subunit [Candidatus Protochlamydia phocaeensis]
MTEQQKKWLKSAIIVLAAVVVAVLAWKGYKAINGDKNIVSANGRIQATEIDIAAKLAGRVKEILVYEGDFVKIGQIIAYMDTDVLNAQLREAEAQLLKAFSNVDVAHSQFNQRKSEKLAAEAVVKQREAEIIVAGKRLKRTSSLVSTGATSQQEADDDEARYTSALAAKDAALAQVAADEAAIVTAREQVVGAESAVKAAQATIERIQADIDDTVLRAPRDGRVQYRVAEPGEVLPAGGRVLRMVDLTDVYMTFFLPTDMAGKIAIGDQVRLVVDAAPELVIPAYATFISDVAQFTPKTVETATEREKLMFRVKAHIPAELLKQHITMVKTGLPGVAYVRLDSSKPWPASLQVKL